MYPLAPQATPTWWWCSYWWYPVHGQSQRCGMNPTGPPWPLLVMVAWRDAQSAPSPSPGWPHTVTLVSYFSTLSYTLHLKLAHRNHLLLHTWHHYHTHIISFLSNEWVQSLSKQEVTHFTIFRFRIAIFWEKSSIIAIVLNKMQVSSRHMHVYR